MNESRPEMTSPIDKQSAPPYSLLLTSGCHWMP